MSDNLEERERDWESRSKLWDEMEAARSRDDERRIHLLKVGGHTISMSLGACACCLMKLYSQVRDNGMLKEGEHFYCEEVCKASGIDGNWIVMKGIVKRIRT